MSAGISQRIGENVDRVRERIESAARASGRSPDSVTLVAVTKYVDADIARLLVEHGCRDLGESRPQALWEKAAALADLDVRWHMIGSLQRNKVARTLPVASLIHSVDSARLANTISRLSVESGTVQDILLEVNISGESAKHGFMPESLPGETARLLDLPGIRVCGLMGMASQSGEAEIHDEFSRLRRAAGNLQSQFQHQADNHPLDQLSMGMSGDFPWAIAEGATIVRIGSSLFQGIV